LENSKVHLTRVLVVDDHDVVRKGICRIIASVPEFDIVCETASGEDAVEKAQEHLPDIVLLDISLAGISGIEVARRIRAISRDSRILFVSQHNSIHVVREALSAGGAGYLLKSEAGRELLNAMRSVQRGVRYVSEGIAFSHENSVPRPQPPTNS
jgi:two-component system invasion response regulator UvrY